MQTALDAGEPTDRMSKMHAGCNKHTRSRRKKHDYEHAAKWEFITLQQLHAFAKQPTACTLMHSMAEGAYVPEVRPDVHSSKVNAVRCMVLCEILACQRAPPAKHTAASWQTAHACGRFPATCPA